MTQNNLNGLIGQLICILFMFVFPFIGFQTDRKLFYVLGIGSFIAFFYFSLIAIG